MSASVGRIVSSTVALVVVMVLASWVLSDRPLVVLPWAVAVVGIGVALLVRSLRHRS